MNVDYIIVGCGLAGIHFLEQLKAHNKSFIVYDNNSQSSSSVAGGLYNPVVLKRFTSIWKGKEQLQNALPIYKRLESQLQLTLDYKIPVLRRFASLEEQNNWMIASDKPILREFLSVDIIPNSNTSINADFGFGEVLQTGRIDTKTLLKAYKKELSSDGLLIEEEFNYNALIFKDGKLVMHDNTAKHVVFAEGFGLKQNPFFNHLPLDGVKGELLTIEAPDLKIDYILKSNIFIFPLGEDMYRVGATYNWKDKTRNITDKARNELTIKLKSILNCPFNIVDQVAGIRPTVKDRRPLVGRHHKYKNLFVLNGLGTRGVIIGPYVAKKLYDFIENGDSLELEININRLN